MKHHAIRLAALLAAALFAAAATAQVLPGQSPQRILRGVEIPVTKATMYIYFGLADSTPGDAPIAFGALAGLDPQVVTRYRAYAKTAVESVRDAEHAQRLKLLCDRRSAITSGTQLTAALVQIDEAVEKVRIKAIADSEKVLGADGKRKVDAYVLATREGMTISEVAPERVVQFGVDSGLTVSGIVAKLCPDR
jgi:hypothetical protein